MEKTKELIKEGNTDEAINRLSVLVANNSGDDNLYYLLGNAYRKKGNWQRAIENYLQAKSINPDSPACEAYEMVMNILEFYNKDMYNQ